MQEYDTPVANNWSVFYVAFKTAMVGKVRPESPGSVEAALPVSWWDQAGLPKYCSVVVEEGVPSFLNQPFVLFCS